MTADPKQLLFHLCIGRGLLHVDITHSKRKVCTTRLFTGKINIGGGWVSTGSKPLPSLWFQSHLPLQTPCVQRQIHRRSWNKKRSSSKPSLNVPLCATGLRGKVSVKQPHAFLLSKALHSLQCISECLLSCIQGISQGVSTQALGTLSPQGCPCSCAALQALCCQAALLHCSTQLQHWQLPEAAMLLKAQPCAVRPCHASVLVLWQTQSLAEAFFPKKCNRVM